MPLFTIQGMASRNQQAQAQEVGGGGYGAHTCSFTPQALSEHRGEQSSVPVAVQGVTDNWGEGAKNACWMLCMLSGQGDVLLRCA